MKARADQQRHAKLISLVGAYRAHLAEQARPELEGACSELMRNLSLGRHPRIHLDDAYELELEDAAGERYPLRLVSGGEQTRANFALRLSVSEMITRQTGTPMRYLVLDEVFASQDEEHRQQMLEALRNLTSTYQQVFVISHVGDLDSTVADYRLSVTPPALPDQPAPPSDEPHERRVILQSL
jgi:exonuclease SbcC